MNLGELAKVQELVESGIAEGAEIFQPDCELPTRGFFFRLPFSVHTPAERPYGVLFAFSSASSGVRNVNTESTGPKISSCAMRFDWETPVKNVGANQKPRDGRLHDD